MTRGRSLHFPSRPPSPVRRPQRGTAVAGTGAGAGEERPSHSAASTEAQAQTPSQASRATASAVMAGQVGGAGAGMGLSAERSRGDPGVYLQEPPLQFNLPGATGVMYDEALSMLLVASHSRLYAWPFPTSPEALFPSVGVGQRGSKTPGDGQGGASRALSEHALSARDTAAGQQAADGGGENSAEAHKTPVKASTGEGGGAPQATANGQPVRAAENSRGAGHGSIPPQQVPQVCGIPPGNVLALRFSLDARILAVQRAPQELELLLFAPPLPPSQDKGTPTSAAGGPSSTSPHPSASLTPTDANTNSRRSSGAVAQPVGGLGAFTPPGTPQAGEALSAPPAPSGRSSSASPAPPQAPSPGAPSPVTEAWQGAALMSSTRRAHVYSCKRASERILGFFWTDCPLCNLVIVTTSGLEMFAVSASAKGDLVMRLVEVRPLAIVWYAYAPDSRILITASGPRCRSLSGLQFCNTGVLRIPPFEAVVSALPASAPGGVAPGSTGAASAAARGLLSPQDLKIVSMYNMVFCLQLDRPGLLLHCHRLFRDAVQLQARVRLLAPQVALSVVDNLLVLHYPALHCLSLLDPLAPSWEPLLPPLPLGRQGALSPAPAPAMARGLAPAASPDDAPAVEGARGTHHGTGSVDPTEYSRQWVFLSPCLVLDKAHGRLQRLALDLSALAAMLPGGLSQISFLQRRTCHPALVHRLTMGALEAMLRQERALSEVGDTLDILFACYAASPGRSARESSGAADGPGPRRAGAAPDQGAPESAYHQGRGAGQGTTGQGAADLGATARASAEEGPPGVVSSSDEGRGAGAGGEGGDGVEAAHDPGPKRGLHWQLSRLGLSAVARELGLLDDSDARLEPTGPELSPGDILLTLVLVACSVLEPLGMDADMDSQLRAGDGAWRLGESGASGGLRGGEQRPAGAKSAAAYLAAVGIEFLRSCRSAGLSAPTTSMSLVMASLLGCSSQWSLLVQIIQSKVLVPSAALALHLVRLACLSEKQEAGAASEQRSRKGVFMEGLRMLAQSASGRELSRLPTSALQEAREQQQALATLYLAQGSPLLALKQAAALVFEPSHASWSFGFLETACKDANEIQLAAVARLLAERHLPSGENKPLHLLHSRIQDLTL